MRKGKNVSVCVYSGQVKLELLHVAIFSSDFAFQSPISCSV